MSDTVSFMDPTGKVRALIERKDAALASSQARIQELEKALTDTLAKYVALVNCGDCGNWDPYTEDHVIASNRVIHKDSAS